MPDYESRNDVKASDRMNLLVGNGITYSIADNKEDMISKSKKIVTIGLCACLLFGCKESNAESKMESGISTFHADQKILEEHSESKVNVEEQCKALSERDGYEYNWFSGVVLTVDKIADSEDCWPGCKEPPNRKKNFLIALKNDDQEIIGAYGENVLSSNVYERILSIEKGAYYGFCARKKEKTPENRSDLGVIIAGKDAYKIDYFDTIQEIVQGE